MSMTAPPLEPSWDPPVDDITGFLANRQPEALVEAEPLAFEQQPAWWTVPPPELDETA